MIKKVEIGQGHLSEQAARLPRPLVGSLNGEVGFSMGFREGERVVVRGRTRFYPAALFSAAIAGSHALGGQPIRVGGFVPGVSMRAAVTNLPHEKVNPDIFIPELWNLFRPHFERWQMEFTASPSLHLVFESVGLEVQIARDHLEALKPGVMQIDVED